ncbi:MAG: LysE family transporter [Candidatus Helarchaeota archaeon]
MLWIILALENIFFVAFIIAFSGAVMPGPVLIGVIKETPTRGYSTGALFIVGHMFCEIPIVIFSFLGLAVILSIPVIFSIISILGGSTLFFLAGLTLRDVRTTSLEEEIARQAESPSRGRHPIIQGAVLSIVGPYWILWWATTGITNMGTLNVVAFGALGAITYLVGHVLADYLWYSAISVIIQSGKKIITDRVYKAILVVSAGIFCYFGFKFIYLASIKILFGIDLSSFFIL